MNTFTSAVFLLLATSTAAQNNASDECYNDRPRPVRSGERNRFDLKGEDKSCADDDKYLYQYGQINGVHSSDDCANECVNGVGGFLYEKLRGFEYNCPKSQCRCLYDEGVINEKNADTFDSSNYMQKMVFAIGEISKTVNNNDDFACYKRVGTEYIGDVVEMFRLRGSFKQSAVEGSSVSHDAVVPAVNNNVLAFLEKRNYRRPIRKDDKEDEDTMRVPPRRSEPKFTVDAKDLVSLRLENGDVWTAGKGSKWTERKEGRNGATYNWLETSSDKNSVKLVDDDGRGYYARIGLRAGEVSLCDGHDSGCYTFGTIKDVTIRDSLRGVAAAAVAAAEPVADVNKPYKRYSSRDERYAGYDDDDQKKKARRRSEDRKIHRSNRSNNDDDRKKDDEQDTMRVPPRRSEPKFTVDAKDLVSVRLENGDVWTAGKGSKWTERKEGRNGATYNWLETSSDKNSVKLVDDDGRGYYARIGLRAGEVSLCDGPDSGCSTFGTIKDVTIRD